jgi:hypothetical protein
MPSNFMVRSFQPGVAGPVFDDPNFNKDFQLFDNKLARRTEA